MTLIAYLFLSWRPPKNVVRSMSKKFRFKLPLEKQDGKRFPTLLKSKRQHLYHIYWWMGRQLSCKKSLLLIWKILRLFVNTLIAVDKYSLPNRDNLTQPIQMQLSKKQNTFSQFFSAFPKCMLNFKHFQKKEDPHSLFISEVTVCEKRG